MDGHAPRCVVETGGGRLMYLIGWNRSQTVPYHLSIGCARSDDGLNWQKLPGPVMDRSIDEPFLCTSPCVIRDGGIYRMWYCGGLGWEVHDGRPEPLYRIHHAESRDGLSWRKTPHVCIDTFAGADAIAWPVVWKSRSSYHMIFSYRGRAGYRDDPAHGYRLGYAVSPDGLRWELRNEEVGLHRSAEGWDSVMIAYAAYAGEYLLYNGNGFGATGIGVARRVDDPEGRGEYGGRATAAGRPRPVASDPLPCPN
jgi:catechol 2,3-dioxygenase-like lactoylglutathione lyase family enzyme